MENLERFVSEQMIVHVGDTAEWVSAMLQSIRGKRLDSYRYIDGIDAC